MSDACDVNAARTPPRRAIVDERRARIAWARIGEPANPDVAAWIARHGYVESLRRLIAGELPSGSGAALIERARGVDVDRDEEIAARLGARILTPESPAWPTSLDDLAIPPHCLWVAGECEPADVLDRSVSIVGARAATSYGLQAATDLGHGLADRGFAVVSGAAYGIDAAAHRGALGAEGWTIAVLACGIDRVYPQGNRALLAEIRRVGAIVTELPPGAPPLAHRFLSRNRLIAAMSQGTVVVEAGLRSGSRNTAGEADTINRLVAAVPGPITSPVSAGCHELIRSGMATLVTDAGQVAELVGQLGNDLAPPQRDRAFDALWPLQDREVFGWVPVRRPCGLDELVRASGRSPTALLVSLGRLEEARAVRRSDAGWQKAAGVGVRHEPAPDPSGRANP